MTLVVMTSRQPPHVVQPSPTTVRVALVHKSFAVVSHAGLGLAALNTSRTLRREGIMTEVWPCHSVKDIQSRLESERQHAREEGLPMVSHVVISAPWIPTLDLQKLLMAWPNIHFAVSSHSNLGFLQADPNGIGLLREASRLVLGHHNFSLAGNCERFTQAWSRMYGCATQWLPNLYDVTTLKNVGQRTPWRSGHVLRIGLFGAARPLKNMISGAAACVELSSTLKTDVEIWMSTGRNEGASGTIHKAVEQITSNLPHVKVVPVQWRSWPEFRAVVGQMHLLVSPSYTESFQMVCADGIAEGVATVGSDAIVWIPDQWQACCDDVGDITRVANYLLHDTHAVDHGQQCLREYVARGIPVWKTYLKVH